VVIGGVMLVQRRLYEGEARRLEETATPKIGSQ